MLNQCSKSIEFDVYEPRNSPANHYFRCVEYHFEQVEELWGDYDVNRSETGCGIRQRRV